MQQVINLTRFSLTAYMFVALKIVYYNFALVRLFAQIFLIKQVHIFFSQKRCFMNYLSGSLII